MSDALIEMLGKGYAAHNRGDFEAAFANVPEDFTLRRADGSTLTGRDAVYRFTQPDAFAVQRLEPLEYRARGDVVLVRLMATARGRGSEVEVEQEAFNVWRFRAGLPARMEVYFDEAEAREAAGIANG